MIQAHTVTAEVIAFRPAMARSGRSHAPDDAERGRILFFTGVRYERLDPETVGLVSEVTGNGPEDDDQA